LPSISCPKTAISPLLFDEQKKEIRQTARRETSVPQRNPQAVSGKTATQPFKLVLALADPLSLTLLFIYMLSQSWLRWMDPLIDFPRSLYAAWR